MKALDKIACSLRFCDTCIQYEIASSKTCTKTVFKSHGTRPSEKRRFDKTVYKKFGAARNWVAPIRSLHFKIDMDLLKD